MNAGKIKEDPPFLDDEEAADVKRAVETLERSKGIAGKNRESRLKALRASAKRTVNPPKSQITTRLQTQDLQRLKAIALEKGLPYQALLSSIVHQYVEGRLVERDG